MVAGSFGACGPSGLQTGGTTPELVTVGGGQRAVVSLTDLDQVRDVVISAERAFVATDRGLLAFPVSGEGEPTRLQTGAGLPSNDVRAVGRTSDGTIVALTTRGMARVTGETATAFGEVPPVGEPTAFLLQGNDVWVGGVDGLARLESGEWQRFGEPATITLLEEAQGGGIWVGTTRGLWFIEGDTITEHDVSGGIPEGYVQAIAPVREGEILALLRGPTSSILGLWNGRRWYGYTIENFDVPVVDLVATGERILMLTPGRAYEIASAEGEATGVPLLPLSRSGLRTAYLYGARTQTAQDLLDNPTAERPEAERVVERAATPLQSRPDALATIDAPGFLVSGTDFPVPREVVHAVVRDGQVYMADRNRGVLRVDSTGARTFYRSRDLVHESDLQLAVDAGGNAWIRGKELDVAIYQNGGFVRSAPPEGVVPQSIATGPGGAFVMTMVQGTPATVRLYRVSSDGWTPVLERTFEGVAVIGVPFFGVSDSMRVWAGVRVETEVGARIRGLAVFGEEGPVVYHRRGATAEVDGEGARSMPDEVDGIDLGQTDNAWLPSLEGAIRIGNSQAIVFGEARGVRGEVVSDLAVGDNRVWIAAAEGVGYYENQTFEFRLPRVVQDSRPTRLAIDSGGNVWGAGLNGLVYFDGQNWQTFTEAQGLPTNSLLDVEIDSRDRVWLLAEDQLILFDRQ
ncbi:MAG: hypothetical protein AAGF12_26970 [Myxococcota bacterium]